MSPTTGRIAATFEKLNAEGRKALIPFVTAGFPFAAITPSLMHGMVEAGSDIIELGVPFSDPMADGPVIQKAGDRAIAGLEDKMERVGMRQAERAAVLAQARIPHHLLDIGQVPAHEIARMTDAAVEPFERVFFGPRLREEPTMIGVIIRFDRDDFAESARLEMLTLARKGCKETGALAHHDLTTAGALGCKDLGRLAQIVEKRLGADHVFAGAKHADHMLGVQMIGCINTDHIHRRIGQHRIDVRRITRRIETELMTPLTPKRLVQVA